MTEEFLPPQLIAAKLPKACHITNSLHVMHTDNHWSNETTMKMRIDKIYINDKRKEMKLPHN